MFISLIVIHITVCLILIATILLQAGRGGGLTETFGGESAQSIFGTQTPKILKKATTVSAIVFLLTSLALGMITARRGKSVFDRVRFPNMPVTTTQTTTVVPEQKEAEAVSPASQETVQTEAPAEAEESPISQQ
ncbi:MAG: preprotein translocase subunit SecG [Candidatus Omnitrophota bacterium]